MTTFDAYGQPKEDRNLPIVTFSHEAVEDPHATKREGRPIFQDMEMVKIAFPADRQRTVVRPAHAQWKKIDGRKVTYAERFPEQYARFKADQPQVVEGTPIAEAPFLSEAWRATCKACQVYTVEQLASLQGQPLKNLGPGALEKQQAAEAYLANARGSADQVALAAENARLKETVAAMSAQGADARMKFLEMGDDALKAFIKEKSGESPRGNPNRGTLLRIAVELDTAKTAEAA